MSKASALYVRRCRAALGMTKVAFAAAMSRDRKTVQRWEDGDNEPCFGDIEKMKALLKKVEKAEPS